MMPFNYLRATAPDEAVHAVSARGAKFLGGGTNLVDLMKYNVEHPTTLIDVTHLDFTQITITGSTTLIGAGVRNSDLANHETIRTSYPLLSQALLSGASPQLRNMATTGGNLLQRTRCYYFMDTTFPACNKRTPGSGCAAIKGFNRIHAILGASDECIATNPSDMSVALAALNATIHVTGPKGKRTIAIADFHRLPGTTPQLDTNLKPDELITAVELPASKFAKHSYYLKVRDRQSYAFALVSVAAGLEMSSNTIQSAGLALGGVALKPWRSLEAEKFLVGTVASGDAFRKAADLAVAGAKPYEHNAFKVELARQSIVRALTLAAQGVQA
ncbi:MAG TPA: xanthine dehydrogenase family protein subunit M [Edaphobacter sp.]|jgi:xanthine dehydrogenase YagS FAD-binding subunit|nr:xanthine dehydrogenase family protein subunit M [Edaphobacter sp.]